LDHQFQTSKYFEAVHQPMKRLGEHSNQKEITKFIMEQNNIITHYKTSQQFPDEKELQESVAVKKHEKPKFYTISSEHRISTPNPELMKSLSNATQVKIREVYQGSGIYGADGLVKLGAYLLLQLTDQKIDVVKEPCLVLYGALFNICSRDNTGCPILQLLNAKAFLHRTQHVKVLQQVSCGHCYNKTNTLYLSTFARRTILIDSAANNLAQLSATI